MGGRCTVIFKLQFCTIVSSLVQVTGIYIYLYADLQSTLEISKSRLISSYQYLQVNFLVQENYLEILIAPDNRSKGKDNRKKMSKSYFLILEVPL